MHYLGLGTQSGSYGTPGGLSTLDYKEVSELDVAEDDSFELWLSAQEPGDPVTRRNWLRLDRNVDPHVFIIRQTFIDRSRETPAELTIEKEGPTTKIAGSITAKELEDGLSTAAMFVAAAPIRFVRWANGFHNHVNELPLFDQAVSNKAGVDPNIRYFHSAWRVEVGKALVVDTEPPDCDTWNLQINKYWMEFLDYQYHTIHTDKGLATYRPDNPCKVRIVLSHRMDPAVRGVTWLSTTGHTSGTICFRWVRPRNAEGEIFPVGGPALPHPRARLIRLDQLSSLVGPQGRIMNKINPRFRRINQWKGGGFE